MFEPRSRRLRTSPAAIDERSRLASLVTAHERVTGEIVREAFRHTVVTHGILVSMLTASVGHPP